jgi:histidyl-tRNA synthetase
VKKRGLMRFKSLKGIHDILPPDIHIWQHIESISRDIFRLYGYKEIRLPVIESTELFIRSIGETSDIVEKEMYTFIDKGNRSVTLRPEGTASFVRAYIEHHLYNEPSPQRYYYMGPMFRYERPQAGRYRQFYQIGAEAMGIDDPRIDAETISMLSEILKSIGLEGLRFEITSIGCRECRPVFRSALKEFLSDKIKEFCGDCQRRYDVNPLRILDCKVPQCIEKRKGSPHAIEFLCEGCREHFEKLKGFLNFLHISYMINPELVRGLDYYTRTAFEITTEFLGSQNAIAAGGRYDGLVEEFEGPSTPGLGFAIGMERVVSLLKDRLKIKDVPDLVICFIGDEASERAFLLARNLRSKGLWIETSYGDASLKSQMRKADRLGAGHVIVIGGDELRSGDVELKDMNSGEKIRVSLDAESIARELMKGRRG